MEVVDRLLYEYYTRFLLTVALFVQDDKKITGFL